ncbi:MAG: hypothetical protein ABI689_08045 [Thermoanaerobaculia bacterium]
MRYSMFVALSALALAAWTPDPGRASPEREEDPIAEASEDLVTQLLAGKEHAVTASLREIDAGLLHSTAADPKLLEARGLLVALRTHWNRGERASAALAANQLSLLFPEESGSSDARFAALQRLDFLGREILIRSQLPSGKAAAEEGDPASLNAAIAETSTVWGGVRSQFLPVTQRAAKTLARFDQLVLDLDRDRSPERLKRSASELLEEVDRLEDLAARARLRD